MEHKRIQRRNSILKEVESVNIQVFENGEDQTVTGAFNRRSFKKRVSFADTTSIKEFLASRDAQATEWNCTYEEPVVHDSSSSMEITKPICQANMPVSKAPEGIRLTEDLAYMKENIVDLHKGSLEANQGTNDGAEETYEVPVSNFLSDFLGMKPTEPNHGGTSDKKKKDISLASSDAQLQKTLMFTEDMEMTCNVPQHQKIIMSSEDIVMSNKVHLQNDLKMTNAVLPQKTLLSSSEMENRCQNDSQVLFNVNVSENLENEFKEDELIQDIELDLVEEEMEAVHNDLKCNVQDSSLELSDKAQQFLVAKSKLKEVIDNLTTLPIKTSPYCVTHETKEEQRNLDESIFEFNNTLNVEMEKDNTGTDANYSTFKLKEALNPTKVDYQNICDQFVNDVEKEENKMEICESNLKTSAGIEPILNDEEPQHEFSTYKCKFCSPAFTKDTRQLTTPSGQVFDVSLLENGVLELKKNNPFRILFELSCKNDHLTVIRVVWKPLLQDLKKPSAKLSLATLGQSISIETDKLLSLTFCEAVNHLDKVIEAYERVMKLLATLRMIESVHLTSFSNTGLKVTFSNVKAALKVCVTLELIYDLNEKWDFFRVISTPTVVIGNLRNENLEEAISKVQNGPNKIFKIVKTLASIVRNAT